jgi:hypothetical protein
MIPPDDSFAPVEAASFTAASPEAFALVSTVVPFTEDFIAFSDEWYTRRPAEKAMELTEDRYIENMLEFCLNCHFFLRPFSLKSFVLGIGASDSQKVAILNQVGYTVLPPSAILWLASHRKDDVIELSVLDNTRIPAVHVRYQYQGTRWGSSARLQGSLDYRPEKVALQRVYDHQEVRKRK